LPNFKHLDCPLDLGSSASSGRTRKDLSPRRIGNLMVKINNHILIPAKSNKKRLTCKPPIATHLNLLNRKTAYIKFPFKEKRKTRMNLKSMKSDSNVSQKKWDAISKCIDMYFR